MRGNEEGGRLNGTAIGQALTLQLVVERSHFVEDVLVDKHDAFVVPVLTPDLDPVDMLLEVLRGFCGRSNTDDYTHGRASETPGDWREGSPTVCFFHFFPLFFPT